jgi:hypothetical protein
MFGEFKVFPIYFVKFGGHIDLCECRTCEDRQSARWLIRGCLMFNDLDLQDDPWDYNIAKNRKGS